MAPDLGSLFDFTSDDLAANRKGGISTHQRQQFAARLTRPTGRAIVSDMLAPGCLFIVMPVGCALLALRSFTNGQTPSLIVTLTALIAASVGSVIIIRIYQQVKRSAVRMNELLSSDLETGTVVSARVQVQYDPEDEHLYLANPAQNLWLYLDLSDLLPMNSTYIAYYLPRSETLLSLEAISFDV